MTDSAPPPEAVNTPATQRVIDSFQRRVIQDALTEATAIYWQRRADMFEWARPRPGDRLGVDGRRGAAVIDARLVAARDACLRRAAVAGREGWSAA